jgi:hypothetical protein
VNGKILFVTYLSRILLLVVGDVAVGAELGHCDGQLMSGMLQIAAVGVGYYALG